MQDTVRSCTGIIITRILQVHWTWYYMIHWSLLLHVLSQSVHGLLRYTNVRTTACHIIVSIVTWILGISLLHMHVWFPYSCYIDPRSYYIYYCSMLSPYSCYMLVSRYWSCYFPLLDTWTVDMRCVLPHIYCFPFPVILLAHVLFSYYLDHALF